MRRREFITLLGGTAVAWPLTARAQQPARRIGMLIGYSENDPEIQARLAAFRQALEGNGWKEGRSILIDYRFAPASPDQAQVFAKELVALQPDVLVGNFNPRHSRAAVRDAHHPNRVRGRVRSSRQPLCGEHRAAGRQHDRLH
jgi:putative ABC transport system substrate-binding protein